MISTTLENATFEFNFCFYFIISFRIFVQLKLGLSFLMLGAFMLLELCVLAVRVLLLILCNSHLARGLLNIVLSSY